MTKKQYEALAWAESKFNLAVNSGYVHITRTEFEKVLVTYQEIYGETLSKGQKACPRCVLRAMQKLGKDWFLYKEKQEKKKAKDGKATDNQQPADGSEARL